LDNKLIIDDAALIGKSFGFETTFFLTFGISNRNAHNCMVYLGASTNVMPLTVAQKLGL